MSLLTFQRLFLIVYEIFLKILLTLIPSYNIIVIVFDDMEEYPSPAEGIGLENRQGLNGSRGFESLFLRHYK